MREVTVYTGHQLKRDFRVTPTHHKKELKNKGGARTNLDTLQKVSTTLRDSSREGQLIMCVVESADATQDALRCVRTLGNYTRRSRAA